jgi:hypothetical protein
VPNPSFEIYDTCPYSSLGGQIYFAVPWTGPTDNSTDYYNSCNSTLLGIPGTINGGYQYAKTGNAYAAIRVAGSSDYKEYLQVKLTDSLIVGNCYFVSFFINLFNSSIYATNSIGAYLSNNSDSIFNHSIGQPTLLNYKPQILKVNNPVISDTLNWINISGIFTATGGEQFITIGCFELNSNMKINLINSSGNDGAYYYIDDVSVLEATPIYLQKELTLRDTFMNNGDTILIGNESISGIKYNWYKNNQWLDSIGQIKIHPSITTKYIRTITYCGNTIYDTIVIKVRPTGIPNSVAQNNISIYPNPANEIVYIEWNGYEQQTITIELLSIDGQLLGSMYTNTKTTAINILNLLNGIYILRLTNLKNNEKIYRKIIVQHEN